MVRKNCLNRSIAERKQEWGQKKRGVGETDRARARVALSLNFTAMAFVQQMENV